jgi:hypothetical protein
VTLNPDAKYWIGWAIVFVAARLWLVNPIVRAIREGGRL